MKCLQDELSSKPATAPEHEAWYSAMQEILDHLAKNLVLESFLDILPGPQNTEDFQSYIQLCRKNQQAHQIQSLIVNTGHKLLSTLTFWKRKNSLFEIRNVEAIQKIMIEKNRENTTDSHCLTVDKFDFTRKKSWKHNGFALLDCWQIWFHEKNLQNF